MTILKTSTVDLQKHLSCVILFQYDLTGEEDAEQMKGLFQASRAIMEVRTCMYTLE